ncbi:hypothetical protein DUNSADRAFT_16497 [Dunaliella salina]|uniref:Encoded protein n=1 Tax=Dunaliella salina TaxID=3046 RepID=A0ABQ7G3H8_DUNSA|nr:hypothetical protein DUNSADRAFT_16497 [Dunaliella salina]|eukprot:KAF5829155.1 hypothetical protein DUNSADRAFT_16497 [Dunaliella salina]
MPAHVGAYLICCTGSPLFEMPGFLLSQHTPQQQSVLLTPAPQQRSILLTHTPQQRFTLLTPLSSPSC